MVSKTFTRIMERLEKLNERVKPVADYAERLERMEAKLDQLAELLQAQNKPPAQGTPASTSRATITATPAKAADKK